MEKDKKKIIAGVGVLIGTGIAYLLMRKRQPGEPPEEPPPGEDYGRARGYVLDAETNAIIIGAKIDVDGTFQRYSDTEGTYYTDYFLFGPHTITVEANNYQKTDFPIDLNETLMRVDLALPPLPQAPTEWTEGVEVTKIEVDPSILYLGQTVHIGVSIKYPYPLPLPADIHGSVLIDGTKLSTDVTIDFRNPTLPFQYTPANTGEYLVRAQDKSAGFRVLQDIPATYYSPFGGTRMPLCIDIVIPDVPAFTIPWGYTHPGGDLKFSDVLGWYVSRFDTQFLPLTTDMKRLVVKQLPQASPIAWTPTDATVTGWAKYFQQKSSTKASLLVMATEYSCNPYWDSKEELARMIAGSTVGVIIPDEWKLQYGTTCPTCNGTGRMPDPHSHIPSMTKICSECRGLGKVLRVDLVRGLRDWVKDIRYMVDYYNYTYTSYIWCPYCDKKLVTGTYDSSPGKTGRLEAARFLLNHIETYHPDYPLTVPAWF